MTYQKILLVVMSLCFFLAGPSWAQEGDTGSDQAPAADNAGSQGQDLTQQMQAGRDVHPPASPDYSQGYPVTPNWSVGGNMHQNQPGESSVGGSVTYHNNLLGGGRTQGGSTR